MLVLRRSYRYAWQKMIGILVAVRGVWEHGKYHARMGGRNGNIEAVDRRWTQATYY